MKVLKYESRNTKTQKCTLSRQHAGLYTPVSFPSGVRVEIPAAWTYYCILLTSNVLMCTGNRYCWSLMHSYLTDLPVLTFY